MIDIAEPVVRLGIKETGFKAPPKFKVTPDRSPVRKVAEVPLTLPKELAESTLRDIEPVAYQAASDVWEALEHAYNPRCDLGDQRFSCQDEIQRVLRATGEDPNIDFQRQWMTVFGVFYKLGRSRAMDQGEGRRGSDINRFAAREVQTYLIETYKKEVRIQEDPNLPAATQRSMLRQVAEFALAAADRDFVKRVSYNHEARIPREALLQTYQRVSWGKEETLQMIQEELKKYPDGRENDKYKYSTRNI